VNLRSFRITLFCCALIGLVILPGISMLRAATSASTALAAPAHVTHSFRPSGHGVVIPQKIDTAHLSQIHVPHTAAPKSAASDIQQPVASSSKPARIAHPANVISVPPPTSSDPTAKNGLVKAGFKPDANGAGGYYNYLETVNQSVAIDNRSGNRLMTATFQQWFGTTNSYYDPVTMWDDIGGRFMFSVLQASSPTIWISVAQQANATGKYCNYSFPTLNVHDFDKLGVDQDGIYFGFNVLAPGTNNVVNNELFFASRTALESCQPATYTSWTGLTNPDGTIAQAITPARQDSSTAGVEYLVNSIPAGACSLTLWTLTSNGNLSNTSVATQCYSPPPAAPQKGSTALIDAGDSSITQASYVNGLLTVDNTGSYDFGDGNGPVGIVEWYVLNPSTASIANQGAFGTPGFWLFYPSTITTANGHMLFVYNASGATIYPSIWYVNQNITNAIALYNGTSYYGKSGLSPWGDYQSAWPDTSMINDNAVWITGEYGKTATSWGTAFDLVTP
jgi:hypothetical protein